MHANATDDAPVVEAAGSPQGSLYGDITPEPVTTATFFKDDRPLLVPPYGVGRDSTALLISAGLIPRSLLR